MGGVAVVLPLVLAGSLGCSGKGNPKTVEVAEGDCSGGVQRGTGIRGGRGGARFGAFSCRGVGAKGVPIEGRDVWPRADEGKADLVFRFAGWA